jgi:hypothetical protein
LGIELPFLDSSPSCQRNFPDERSYVARGQKFRQRNYTKMHRFILLLLLVLIQTCMSQISGDLTCQNRSSVRFPSGTTLHKQRDLIFCSHNGESTCCSKDSEKELYTWFGASAFYIGADAEYPFSAECEKYSRSAYCSSCDPYVGLGFTKICNVILLVILKAS